MNDSVSIIGGTITGNKGAEAMLATTIGLLEKKGYKIFNIFSYYPKQDAKLIVKNNVSIYSSTPFYLVFVLFPLSIIFAILQKIKFPLFNKKFPKSIQALSNSKYLYCIAGVSFIDGREKFIPFNVLTLLPAMILRVKVIKLAQAMGPFNNFFNRFFAKFVLSRCFHIYCRGQSTLKNVKSLLKNVDNYSLSSDLVFLYDPTFTLQQYKPNKKIKNLCNSTKKKLIGISPSAVLDLNKKKYFHFLIKIIRELSNNKNYHIIIYPNAVRNSNKIHNNDLVVISNLKKNLYDHDNITFIDYDIHLNDLLELYKNLYLNITSRFHVMIPCLKLSTPTLVIGWSHKYEEILREFGVEKLIFDYKNINYKKFMNILHEVESNRKIYSRLIKTNLPRIRKLTMIQTNEL